MLAKLFSKTGALAGSEFVIKKEAVVGRNSGCDITLFLHTVSNRHARIYLGEDGSAFFLEDLDSSNGTFLDKSQVTSPRRLGLLHVITFANNVDMIFQVFPDLASANIQKPAARISDAGPHTQMQDNFALPAGGLPGMQQMKDPSDEDSGSKTTYGEGFAALPDIPGHDDTVLKDASDIAQGSDVPPANTGQAPVEPVRTFSILINNVHETDRNVVLEEGKSVLGRGDVCTITVRDEYLSGRHALLRVTAGKVFLSDLGSTNGTFVGDEQITEEVELTPGMEFRFGPTTKVLLKEV